MRFSNFTSSSCRAVGFARNSRCYKGVRKRCKSCAPTEWCWYGGRRSFCGLGGWFGFQDNRSFFQNFVVDAQHGHFAPQAGTFSAIDEIRPHTQIFSNFFDRSARRAEIKNLVLKVIGVAFLTFHGSSFHLFCSWFKDSQHIIRVNVVP